jgi:hypothetical protein
VDDFTGDLPPETIANEGGDFLMEARGGLVDNVQNVGDGLKDPPEGMDYASSSPQVDIIGDQWNLNKKKLSSEGDRTNATKSGGIQRRRAAP